MTARALWKGVIQLGDLSIPVKLYSALTDKNVHFRLLHRKDKVPVKQILVNSRTGKVVPFAQVRKAYTAASRQQVILQPHELDNLLPKPSRDIEISRFVPPQALDFRWYTRPYYLGPDGDDGHYFSLIKALGSTGKIGIAHWTMRNKNYHGALTLFDDYPALLVMHSAEEVVPLSVLEAPGGSPLSANELLMARQLITLLDAKFEPEKFSDDYRERVLELIAAKQQGKKIKQVKAPKRRAEPDLSQALQASLQRARS